MLATNFGACAVRAFMAGEYGKMVALQAADIVTVPLSEAIAQIKTVPQDGQLVRTARDTGISFGAPDEYTHHATYNEECGALAATDEEQVQGRTVL
jgi:6-phosphofructokinase 1